MTPSERADMLEAAIIRVATAINGIATVAQWTQTAGGATRHPLIPLELIQGLGADLRQALVDAGPAPVAGPDGRCPECGWIAGHD